MTETMQTGQGVPLVDTPRWREISFGMEFAGLLAARHRREIEGSEAAHLDSPPAAPRAATRMALTMALASVTAALAATTAQCRRSTPPADIEAVTDNAGNLIYRCTHATPHRWNLAGTPLP